MDADFLDRLPKYVTITDGVTDPATAAGCGSTTPDLAFTPDDEAAEPSLQVSIVSASTDRSGNSDLWSAVIVVKVTDVSGVTVSGVTVEGTWSDGATDDNGCSTTNAGTCTFGSNHPTADTATARTWTATRLVKTGYTDSANAVTVSCKRSGVRNGTTLCTMS